METKVNIGRCFNPTGCFYDDGFISLAVVLVFPFFVKTVSVSKWIGRILFYKWIKPMQIGIGGGKNYEVDLRPKEIAFPVA